LTLQYDAARRYFGRATTADNRFAPGWLAYGHAFAAQDESDQVQHTPDQHCKQLLYSTASCLKQGLHACYCGLHLHSPSLPALLPGSISVRLVLSTGQHENLMRRQL
jgi:hypothetical protein